MSIELILVCAIIAMVASVVLAIGVVQSNLRGKYAIFFMLGIMFVLALAITQAAVESMDNVMSSMVDSVMRY